MSPRAAGAASIGLVGGCAALLYFAEGLPLWAGFIAWAAYVGMRGAPSPLKQTIAGAVFGIAVAWVAEVLAHLVPIPPDTWLWIPRGAVAVAATLPILALATQFELLENVFPALCGYAAVFEVLAVPAEHQTNLQRLTGLHLYNPIFLLTISMAGGAVCGFAAKRLGDALTTARAVP
jgi:hypothetical protein